MENLEKIDSELVRKINSLKSRVDSEFSEYKEKHLAGLREEYKKLKRKKLLRAGEDVEVLVNKKRVEFSSLDILSQIDQMLNNFHFWLPGGYYRERHKQDSDSREKRLIGDIDEAIRKLGYESVAEKVARGEGLNRPRRLIILAEIFLAMRDKGYDLFFMRG